MQGEAGITQGMLFSRARLPSTAIAGALHPTSQARMWMARAQAAMPSLRALRVRPQTASHCCRLSADPAACNRISRHSSITISTCSRTCCCCCCQLIAAALLRGMQVGQQWLMQICEGPARQGECRVQRAALVIGGLSTAAPPSRPLQDSCLEGTHDSKRSGLADGTG